MTGSGHGSLLVSTVEHLCAGLRVCVCVGVWVGGWVCVCVCVKGRARGCLGDTMYVPIRVADLGGRILKWAKTPMRNSDPFDTGTGRCQIAPGPKKRRQFWPGRQFGGRGEERVDFTFLAQKSRLDE